MKKFRDWMNENEEYFSSKEFGKGLTGHLSQRNINVDGEIVIDFSGEVNNKTIFADYQIFDIDKKLLKAGKINYYDIPGSIVIYIVYEIAKSVGIYYPSNFILDDGNFSGAGIAQPSFNQNDIKKYQNIINKYI